jgi:hypothetical protein
VYVGQVHHTPPCSPTARFCMLHKRPSPATSRLKGCLWRSGWPIRAELQLQGSRRAVCSCYCHCWSYDQVLRFLRTISSQRQLGTHLSALLRAPACQQDLRARPQQQQQLLLLLLLGHGQRPTRPAASSRRGAGLPRAGAAAILASAGMTGLGAGR